MYPLLTLRNRNKLTQDLFSWHDTDDVYRVACDLLNHRTLDHDQVMHACALLRLNNDTHADRTADLLLTYYTQHVQYAKDVHERIISAHSNIAY
jgi:hypothetical protein